MVWRLLVMFDRILPFTSMKKNLKSVSQNVVLLGIVSFLNDLSSEIIIPVLPMFITALGGGGMAVGLTGGLRDSVSSLLKVFSGYWSDRTGKRKVFIISGYLTSAVFKFFLVFATIWQHISLFTGLERVGKGLRTAPRDAIIADSMPDQRGKGFGIHRALDTAGAIVGSVIAFLLVWFLEFDIKTIILAASVIALFSLIPLWFVKEPPGKPKKVSLKVGLKSLPSSLKVFLLVAGIFAFANFSYMFFILRAQQLFEGKWAMGAPILLYVLYNVFYAGLSIPFGKLSDKAGRKKVLAAGYLLFVITSLGFAFFNSLTAYILLFALYGTVFAIIDGNQRAIVSDLAPEGLKATALGAFHTVTGLVTLPSSLLAGLLWQINPALTFGFGAAVSLVSVVLFILFGNKFR